MSNTITACMYDENGPEFRLNIESRVRCGIILSLAEKRWGFKLWEDFETWLLFWQHLRVDAQTSLYYVECIIFSSGTSTNCSNWKGKCVWTFLGGYLSIKCNSVLPAKIPELSARVSKYKWNEHRKSIFLSLFSPLLTRIVVRLV